MKTIRPLNTIRRHSQNEPLVQKREDPSHRTFSFIVNGAAAHSILTHSSCLQYQRIRSIALQTRLKHEVWPLETAICFLMLLFEWLEWGCSRQSWCPSVGTFTKQFRWQIKQLFSCCSEYVGICFKDTRWTWLSCELAWRGGAVAKRFCGARCTFEQTDSAYVEGDIHGR